ncbi:MAG TPA: 3-hydroxybutyrate oligomer hydrolase family protein [Rhodanobacteraceae bacterium]
MALPFTDGPIRRTRHAAGDDLLSAGLGLAGIAGVPAPFADPAHPTPRELRRRAIQKAWKGITDLGPLGGFGRLYGCIQDIPGREYSTFARLPHARQPHRVLCQIPDAFDPRARCLVVGPASGSRGVYGAIALAGAWALTHGCAVAYTDKGAGTGYFDCADGTGVALDGTRTHIGAAPLEFEPEAFDPDAGIAVKHAHSRDNPEADWGRHVLQAVEFGLAMLDDAFPGQAPFTPANTRIIAVGLSNGGGAVLDAAGLDTEGWLDGVVALAPNVHVAGHGRALYDYASEAALWAPLALTAGPFDATPFARIGGVANPAWRARGSSLVDAGRVPAGTADALADAALERLRASGWSLEALATAASVATFGLWRAVTATYAAAYLRAPVGAMPCGFAFHPVDVPGVPRALVHAAWWSDAAGIPPDLGIALTGGTQAGADPALPGALALRALWDAEAPAATILREAVATLAVRLPRDDLPVWVIHGAEDGLIPAAFTSDAYVEWLRGHGRAPRYWRLPHAQHFDAFLQLPAFGDRYVPLLPYAYAALDAMYAHVVHGAPLRDSTTPRAQPRGAGMLTHAALDLTTAT